MTSSSEIVNLLSLPVELFLDVIPYNDVHPQFLWYTNKELTKKIHNMSPDELCTLLCKIKDASLLIHSFAKANRLFKLNADVQKLIERFQSFLNLKFMAKAYDPATIKWVLGVCKTEKLKLQLAYYDMIYNEGNKLVHTLPVCYQTMILLYAARDNNVKLCITLIEKYKMLPVGFEDEINSMELAQLYVEQWELSNYQRLYIAVDAAPYRPALLHDAPYDVCEYMITHAKSARGILISSTKGASVNFLVAAIKKHPDFLDYMELNGRMALKVLSKDNNLQRLDPITAAHLRRQYWWGM